MIRGMGSAESDGSPVEGFLRRYEADAEAGEGKTLREYLELFPGDEAAVARAFLGLGEAPETECEDGDRIGRYRLVRELGRGGQGTVWLAEDTELSRRVALKVLNGVGPGAEVLLKRFRREAAIEARLRHPGICAIHDTGITRGLPWIAMEFVEGESLAAKLSMAKAGGSGTLDLTALNGEASAMHGDEAATPAPYVAPTADVPTPAWREQLRGVVELVEEAARALHAAHEAGIIHRDVKPGNMMMVPGGRVIILDFGMARGEDDVTLTRTGDLLGTPAYMSPEQLTAHRVTLDRRTDVYSLGVVLFECLTLKRPFEAPTREGLYQAILSKDPPDPQTLNRAVPDDLRVICEVALEKDRDRRYQTALELAEDLRRFRTLEPIRAKPITRWVKFKRWVQRKPGVAASLMAAFVILVAGTAVSTGQAVRADAAATRATKSERDAKDSLALAKTNEKKAEDAARRAQIKANEARKNAEEANANLKRWRRMADVRLLKDLQREADQELWPAWPEKLPAMEDWLRRAEGLKARLPDHVVVLEELRKKAPGLTAVEVQQQRAAHPRFPELMDLQEKRDALPREIAVLEKKVAELEEQAEANPRMEVLVERAELEVEDKREALDELVIRIEKIEAVISKRSTWSFSDNQDRYQHEVYADLVEGARALVADGGLMDDVRARLAFASRLEQKSLHDEVDAWNAAIANVATDPRFKGFQLRRQMGLVPLGPDPSSKLEEFWLYEEEFGKKVTGDRPERDAAGELVITDTTGVVLVLIPGGTFTMGSQRSDPSGVNYDMGSQPDERPPHPVTLTPYFLSKFEMTQSQWSLLARNNPAHWRPPQRQGIEITVRHPVERVSWTDCQRILPRAGLVLPTEAQWERACRAGTHTMYWCGEDKASIQAMGAGNVADLTAGERTTWAVTEMLEDGHVPHAPVGSFAPNRFGLYDTLGNVWEWCADRYDERGYDQTPREGDGLRQGWGVRPRSARGGSFFNTAESARSASRDRSPADERGEPLGCRPARQHF